MHNLWVWLTNNAGAIQAFSACMSVAFAAFTSVVLVIAYLAARAQTNAAKAQALAAIKQAESAETQMVILEKQVMAARRQIDETVRPMLFLPAAASALPGQTKIEIQNLGSGPAMEITYAYARFGDRHIDEEWVVPATIVKGASFPFVIDPERVRRDGLVFLYQSLSGTNCVSEVTDQRPYFRYYPDAHDWVQSLRRGAHQ